jgi:hypothetical protein
MNEILAHLDSVAEDRIRDARAAKSLLLQLIKAVKSAGRDGVPLPVPRIVDRLCYFANARDTAIRSGALRTVRYLLVSAEAAVYVTSTRFVLSVVRSLEREPRYLWERIQALKVVRTLMDVAPASLPMAFLRSLVSIATYVPSVGPAAGPGSPSGGPGAAGREGFAPGGRAPGGGVVERVDQAGAAGVGLQAPQAAAAQPAALPDNLKRVALDTLRCAALNPVLLPRVASCGGLAALMDAASELSAVKQEQVRLTCRARWRNALSTPLITQCLGVLGAAF